MKLLPKCLMPLLFSAASCIVPLAAHAAVYNQVGTPAGSCQGALPSFEGALRKRPLAIQNEASTGAFVTCSFPISGDAVLLRLAFISNANRDVAISCTLVTEYSGSTPGYSTKTVTAPASGARASLSWNGSDITGTPVPSFGTGYLSASCSLPAGSGLTDSFLQYED